MISSRSDILLGTGCFITILAIVVRPRRIPEYAVALGVVAVLTILSVISRRDVYAYVTGGADVYAFLAGMMVLSELARREGVFAWLAAHAVGAARGSSLRLFALVYLLGVVVTAVLSNDATAVVVTPAVCFVARAARAPVEPVALACAFVAGAASFVLPISNPANLVVYGSALPALWPWMQTFALPSLAAIAFTFVAVLFTQRVALRAPIAATAPKATLGTTGRIALGAICVAVLALSAASAFGLPLGVSTLACGAIALFVVTGIDRGAFLDALRGVSWGTLALVAALFVLAGAVAHNGWFTFVLAAENWLTGFHPFKHALALGVPAAIATNVMNNLPAALLAGKLAAASGRHSDTAILTIAMDLGPNLATSGSLATILWLEALKREGVELSRARFFRVGLLAMPLALIAALAALTLSP